jgi:gliding motility-associated-like protein
MHKYYIIAVLMLISAHAFTQSVVVLDTTVNIADPLVNCGEDSQVSMQGGIADYYQWYKNGQPLEGATQRNYIAQVSGTYFLKVSDTAGNSATGRLINILIFPKPVVQFTVNELNQCLLGNQFIFTNTSTITSGYLSPDWKLGDGINSGAISPKYSYFSPGSYAVTLIVTSDQGCKDSITKTINVYASPQASYTINAVTQCYAGNSFDLTNTSALSVGTMKYFWDLGDGRATSENENINYSYSAPGTYKISLQVISPNNCRADYATYVYVNPTPSGKIKVPVDTNFCEGSFVRLETNAANTYQWLFNGAPLTGANAQVLNAAETGAYKVILTNEYGCAAFADNEVRLNKLLKPIAAFSFDKTCVGFATTFVNQSVVNASGLIQFRWTFGDGDSSVEINPIHSFLQSGIYDVQLTISPKYCPQLAQTLLKKTTIQPETKGVRYATVNAVASRNLQLNARNISAASYNWSPTTGLSNAGIYNPVFNYTTTQQYLMEVTTTDGCSLTDTLLVRVFREKQIFVPDLFSPNGDGKNDRLTPIFSGINHLKSFRVFNRWGQIVFQTSKMGDGWDGMLRGVNQPVETYTWMVEALDLDDQSIIKTGSVILVR